MLKLLIICLETGGKNQHSEFHYLGYIGALAPELFYTENYFLCSMNMKVLQLLYKSLMQSCHLRIGRLSIGQFTPLPY